MGKRGSTGESSTNKKKVRAAEAGPQSSTGKSKNKIIADDNDDMLIDGEDDVDDDLPEGYVAEPMRVKDVDKLAFVYYNTMKDKIIEAKIYGQAEADKLKDSETELAVEAARRETELALEAKRRETEEVRLKAPKAEGDVMMG